MDIRKQMYSWHQCIGYIPQTIYLMDDTIRANIAFGIPEDEVDDERITLLQSLSFVHEAHQWLP